MKVQSDGRIMSLSVNSSSIVGSYTRIGYIYAVHEDYVELMPTWGYGASAFVLFIIGFFGFFLNLMVIILMFKDKQLWTPLNVILFNLVCSDFSVSIFGNPFTLISALSHRWVFGKTMCVMYGFFMTLLGITSITTLTVLSFERYMTVSRPLSVHQLSMKGATFSVAVIWCYSFAVSSPPLFGWGNFVSEAANISCSINWEEQTTNTLTYILFLFATGLILPVGIIVFSYMNILKTMKKNAMRMGRVSRAESRVTTMVFVMIITFLIAWTPYSIFALLEQFSPYDLISPGLAVVPALIAKSSICYDPIIYVGMNSQFRASVKKIFGVSKNEDSVQDRGIDNTLMSPTKQASQTDDIRLHYLNSSVNPLTSTTMYKDDMSRSIVRDNVRHSRENNQKKVMLVDTGNEDSTDISGESNNKEHKQYNELKTNNNKSILCNKKDKNTKKYVTYNLENLSDNEKRYNGDIFEPYPIQNNLFNDNSSSKNNNLYKSHDMLLYETDYRKNNGYGIDNNGLMSWRDTHRTNETKDKIFLLDSHTTQCLDVSPLPLRRKSLACTTFTNDPFELSSVHQTTGRRSSSSVLSGHTRKLSTTMYGAKGTIMTRLLVDERERNKLMCFEEMKHSYIGPHSSNEHML